jgi:hypothetical protein
MNKVSHRGTETQQSATHNNQEVGPEVSAFRLLLSAFFFLCSSGPLWLV